MSQFWKCLSLERSQHPTISVAALSVLSGVKLMYQREKGKGKSSATSNFPGSFKIAKERCQCGRSEASALGSVGSAVAFPLLPLSDLAAVAWMKGEVPCIGHSTAARVLLHLPVLRCCPGTANSNTVSGKDCFETPRKTSQLVLMALQEVEIKCNQDWNCQCETDPLLSKTTGKVPQTPGTRKGSREKG